MFTGQVDPWVESGRTGSGQDFCNLRRVGSGLVGNSSNAFFYFENCFKIAFVKKHVLLCCSMCILLVVHVMFGLRFVSLGPFTVRRFLCSCVFFALYCPYVLYYCNTVGWTW